MPLRLCKGEKRVISKKGSLRCVFIDWEHTEFTVSAGERREQGAIHTCREQVPEQGSQDTVSSAQ